MKIQYMSDIHLEFEQNALFFRDNMEITAEYLIIAGDFFVFNKKLTPLQKEIISKLSKSYKKVMIVFGNHEFYAGYLLNPVRNKGMVKLEHNIEYLYNQKVIIDDVTFLFSTLWSKIPSTCEKKMIAINDFNLIKVFPYTNITVPYFNHEHENCALWIKKLVKSLTNTKIVVVSHHVPSYSLLDQQHENSSLNCAFATDMDDYIEQSNIAYWIYGHSHFNAPEKKIGNTTLLTNQLGYTHLENTKKDFIFAKTFSL